MESFERWFLSAKEALKAFVTPAKAFGDVFSNPWISFGTVMVVFICLLVFCILRFGKDFHKTFQKSQTLAIAALLISVNIILGYHTIKISDSLRIGFGFVTQPMIAMLFGPLVCCITGVVQDIISLLLQPTGAYIPAYSLSVGVSGMFYGMMLYRKKPAILRIILVECLVVFVGNILLNSIALAPTVGSGFVGILPARILKNVLVLPVQTVVVYFLLNFMKKSKITDRFSQ